MIKENRSTDYATLIRGPQAVKVTVGIHSEQGSRAPSEYANGSTVAEIAERHEFGIGIVQRSFIRAWYDGELPALQRDIQQEAPGMLSRGPATVAERLALRFQGRAQAWLGTPGNVQPDILQSTKDRKGSSMPLIDHGILKASIMGQGQVTA